MLRPRAMHISRVQGSPVDDAEVCDTRPLPIISISNVVADAEHGRRGADGAGDSRAAREDALDEEGHGRLGASHRVVHPLVRRQWRPIDIKARRIRV